MVKELSKVEFRDGYWLVLVKSPVHGRWIIQGEHLSQEAADKDRRENWL